MSMEGCIFYENRYKIHLFEKAIRKRKDWADE